MTALVSPDVSLHRAWTDAVEEFGADPIHGSGFWHLSPDDRRDLTTGQFADLVAELVAWADPRTPLPEDRVPSDYFWITDGSQDVVGFLALRHALTPYLLEEGGHIGYSVRPSRRRQGHAGRALRLSLARARELGLDRVLLTCDEDNVASRLTIEGGGGVYEDTRKGKQRFWIDLSAD